jgi:hypothetical protein
MLVAKVNRPDTGSSANVEDTLNLGTGKVRRAQTELVIKSKQEQVMLQICIVDCYYYATSAATESTNLIFRSPRHRWGGCICRREKHDMFFHFLDGNQELSFSSCVLRMYYPHQVTSLRQSGYRQRLRRGAPQWWSLLIADLCSQIIRSPRN